MYNNSRSGKIYYRFAVDRLKTPTNWGNPEEIAWKYQLATGSV